MHYWIEDCGSMNRFMTSTMRMKEQLFEEVNTLNALSYLKLLVCSFC
jgi:hypothetical protein